MQVNIKYEEPVTEVNSSLVPRLLPLHAPMTLRAQGGAWEQG